MLVLLSQDKKEEVIDPEVEEPKVKTSTVAHNKRSDQPR